MENELRIRVGSQIATLRKEQGLSQRDLAERCGMNPSNIARIELGRYSVGLDILQRILESLDSDVTISKKNHNTA